MLIAGLAGAAYVEDDIVMTPQRSVIADGTRAVVSSPKALAYKGSTVIIKATGSRGDTFIGLAHRVRALGVAKAVMEYLRTGRTSQIAPDDVMKDFRRDAVKLDAYTARAELKADFGRKAKDQTGTDGSVKVVRTEQGLLAAVSLDVRNTVIAQPDAYFTWKEAFATLYKDTSRHTTLTRRSAMEAFVGITKGRPKVVCSDWGSVL